MGDMSPEEILALTEEASRGMEGGEEDFSLPSSEPAPEPGMARKAQDTLYGPVTQGAKGPELNSTLSSLGDLAKSGAEKFMGALGAPKGLMMDSPAYAAMLAGPPEWSSPLVSSPAAKAKLAAPPQRENAAGQLMGKMARVGGPLASMNPLNPLSPLAGPAMLKDKAMDELASLQQKAQQEGRSSDAFQYQKLQEMLDNVEGIGSSLLTDPMMMSGSFLKLLQGAPKAAQFLNGAIPGLGRALGLGAKASVPVMAADAIGRTTGSAMDEGSRAAALPELPDAALQSFFLAKQGKGLKEQRDADVANALPGIRKGLHIKHPLPLEERITKFTDPKKSPDQVSRVNDLVAKFSRLFSLWSGTGGTNVRANLGNVARFGQHEAATPATSFKVVENLLNEMAANRDPSLPHTEKTRPLGNSFTEADLLARLDGQGLTPQDVRTVFTLLNQQGFIQKGSTRGSGGEVSYTIRDPKGFELLRTRLAEVVPPESLQKPPFGPLRDEMVDQVAKTPDESLPPIPLSPVESSSSSTPVPRAAISQPDYNLQLEPKAPPPGIPPSSTNWAASPTGGPSMPGTVKAALPPPPVPPPMQAPQPPGGPSMPSTVKVTMPPLPTPMRPPMGPDGPSMPSTVRATLPPPPGAPPGTIPTSGTTAPMAPPPPNPISSSLGVRDVQKRGIMEDVDASTLQPDGPPGTRLGNQGAMMGELQRLYEATVKDSPFGQAIADKAMEIARRKAFGKGIPEGDQAGTRTIQALWTEAIAAAMEEMSPPKPPTKPPGKPPKPPKPPGDKPPTPVPPPKAVPPKVEPPKKAEPPKVAAKASVEKASPMEKGPPKVLSPEQTAFFQEKGIPLKKAQQLLELGRDGAWEALANDKTLKGLSPQARMALLRKLFAPSLAPPPGVGPHQVLKAPPPSKSEE